MSLVESSELFYEFSIVVLTYNRAECLRDLLSHVAGLTPYVAEVIVVDNASNDGTQEIVRQSFPGLRYCRTPENLGTAGRNFGITAATGDIVITLDDDVFGITTADLARLRGIFADDPSIGAVNFRVLDFYTGRLTNWVHHRNPRDAEGTFETYEITEGAVAFRRRAAVEVGMYWPRFFIGHEGPDLAFRLMNFGYRVIYDGSISVHHKHESSGRPSWRFYYYDTRNSIWLAVRSMSASYGIRYLAVNIAAMGYYSLRGGQILWWLKALRDGISGLPEARRTRRRWSSSAEARIRQIDRSRPPFTKRVLEKLRGSDGRLDE